MKLLNLIALSVSASLFVAADVAWASDASTKKLDLDSTEETKGHLRGSLRGPVEERVASLEPLAAGIVRLSGGVPAKIGTAGMSAEALAKNVGLVNEYAANRVNFLKSVEIGDGGKTFQALDEVWGGFIGGADSTKMSLAKDAPIRPMASIRARQGKGETLRDIVSNLVKVKTANEFKPLPAAVEKRLAIQSRTLYVKYMRVKALAMMRILRPHLRGTSKNQAAQAALKKLVRNRRKQTTPKSSFHTRTL
ncbi:unnamed protein product [Hyaloperonospora brassicae]|uniref:RxLR effector protein n=1 Tax=Hyaloperonospora brassicae TaxID=162125 RepID=A0AAV0UUF5_HYABA|nr:unnamed protein product [Hyaloperonospora brassicae]